MTPILLLVNCTYCGSGNAVLFGKGDALFSIGAATANLAYLVLGEFSRVVCFAYVRLVAALFHLVLHVVRVCSEKEVRGIATGRVVTMVADFHPLWDRAVGKLPREAMSADASAVYGNQPIAMPVMRTNPQPAIIGAAFIHLLPEAFQDRAIITVPAAPHVMVVDEAHGLSLDAPSGWVSVFRQICLSAAATFTVSIRNFVVGHRKTSCWLTNALAKGASLQQEAMKHFKSCRAFCQNDSALSTYKYSTLEPGTLVK